MNGGAPCWDFLQPAPVARPERDRNIVEGQLLGSGLVKITTLAFIAVVFRLSVARYILIAPRSGPGCRPFPSPPRSPRRFPTAPTPGAEALRAENAKASPSKVPAWAGEAPVRSPEASIWEAATSAWPALYPSSATVDEIV